MKKLLFIFTILFAVSAASPAFAASARMDNVAVGTVPFFNVSFVVHDAFNDDIEKAIKSGLPTSFTFVAELYRTRRFWRDSFIGTWKFNHTVKYDSLKQEYEITLEEEGDTSVRTKDYDEMMRLMASGNNVTLLPSPPLKPGARYEIRLMAELDTIELPFLLRHMLFFVKYWDFETDWYKYGFSL